MQNPIKPSEFSLQPPDVGDSSSSNTAGVIEPEDISEISLWQQIGQKLKQERELRGIGLQDVVQALKVPQRRIQELEKGFNPTEEGTTVFAKGHLRMYARFLKIDISKELESLPIHASETHTAMATRGTIDKPIHLNLNDSRLHYNQQQWVQKTILAIKRQRNTWLGLGLLLVAVFILWYFNSVNRLDKNNVLPTQVATELPATIDSAKNASPDNASATNPLNPSAQISLQTLPSSPPPPLVNVTPNNLPPTPAPPAQVSLTPSEQTVKSTEKSVAKPPESKQIGKPTEEKPLTQLSQSVSEQIVSFSVQAKNDSWLQIVDGKGKIIQDVVIKSGDKKDLSAPLPMRIVVGDTKSVVLQYGGKVQKWAVAPGGVGYLELTR